MLPIYDYKRIMRVKNPTELETAQARNIADKKAYGFEVHTITTEVFAFFNLNRWVIESDCGSGCVVDEDSNPPVARCFGCGGVYTNVTFPPFRNAIEALVLHRPNIKNRNWNLGETVGDMQKQNRDHGLPDTTT